MGIEQYAIFPKKEKIIKAEEIASQLLDSDLPRTLVELRVEGKVVERGLSFPTPTGHIIITNHMIIDNQDKPEDQHLLFRVPFSSN